MTELEFKKACRTIIGQRDDNLWLGDVFGRIDSAEMRSAAKRLGKSLRSAQEYKQTSRMCTAPVRERLSTTRVLVSYSVLREGARADQSKNPHDEGFRALLQLTDEAEQSGAGFVGLTDYRIAIGLGPRVEDLFGPDGSDEEFREYLRETEPGPERDRFYLSLAAQQAEKAARDNAISAVVAAQKAAQRERRTENERLGTRPDPKLAEETAFAHEVCSIAASIDRLADRYGYLDPTRLREERNRIAIDLAQSRIGAFDAWLAGRIPPPGAGRVTAIPTQRGGRRTPAVV